MPCRARPCYKYAAAYLMNGMRWKGMGMGMPVERELEGTKERKKEERENDLIRGMIGSGSDKMRSDKVRRWVGGGRGGLVDMVGLLHRGPLGREEERRGDERKLMYCRFEGLSTRGLEY